MRRTGKGTQCAIAAESHVDIVDMGSHLDRRAIRSKDLRLFLAAFLALYGDAFGRTNSRTLAAADAILNFVEQARAGPLRHGPFFRRILKSNGTSKEMPAGNPHRIKHRYDPESDILKIIQHAKPQKLFLVNRQPANAQK